MADPSFLLDSNICIYVLGDAEGSAARRLGETYPGEVVTSMIAYAEVLRGIPAEDAAGRRLANAFFDVISPLAFDRAAAEAYSRLPFKRARFDRLIAAHALALGVTLVTNNAADFADVAGLKIENWAA